MDYKSAKNKILAAQALLLEPTSSFEKFSAIKKLLDGAHPQLDAALKRCEQDLQPLQQILGKDFFGFAAENLPEVTEEQKQRKRAVLLFWKTWNNLRGEVSRVQVELDAMQNSPDATTQASHWGRIFNFAKGPFGILTILAVGLVSASAYTSVQITIHNDGCATMIPSSTMPNWIPGISFPSAPIADGDSATAALPGLPFTIDGTKKGALTASALKFTMTFNLGDVTEVKLDGKPLMGKVTDVNLGEKKTHDLEFICS